MKKKLFVICLFFALCMICSCKKEQQFLPDIPIILEPDMYWDVKTDYSKLSEYVPKSISHSRPADGNTSEFTPKPDYGLLLPYAGSVHSTNITKYGLVTINGMIVTDPIYENVSPGSIYETTSVTVKPVYLLSINQETDNEFVPYERRLAVCAMDGSWITPFDFLEVRFTNEYIILHREYNSFDMDIYDYEGEFLFNTLAEFEEFYDVSGYYGISYVYTDEAFGVHTANELLFINVPMKECIITEFVTADVFSEGISGVCVRINEYESKWGYIDEDLNLIIEPIYDSVSWFHGGRAVVNLDGRFHLIDKNGNILMTADEGYTIQINHDNPDFSLYGYNNGDSLLYFADLSRIPTTSIHGQYENIVYYGSGWYIADLVKLIPHSASLTNDKEYIGKVVFNPNESHIIPGVIVVYQIVGDYIYYARETSVVSVPETGGLIRDYSYSIAKIGGDDIITVLIDEELQFAADGEDLKAIIVRKRISGFDYFIHSTDASYTYRLLNIDGSEIKSGRGYLTYNPSVELYTLIENDTFSYLDPEGNVIISIPMMSYLSD